MPANLLDVTLTLVMQDSKHYRLFGPDGELLLEGQVGEKPQSLPGTAELRLRVSGLQAHPGSRFNLVRQERLTAIKALKDRFSAKETSRQSALIRLTLLGSNRLETAVILNEIIRIFVEQKSRFLSVEAERTLDFLHDHQLRIALFEIDAFHQQPVNSMVKLCRSLWPQSRCAASFAAFRLTVQLDILVELVRRVKLRIAADHLTSRLDIGK
nr:hypothetical protein [endosymbiont of Lamellibrachia barhami]